MAGQLYLDDGDGYKQIGFVSEDGIEYSCSEEPEYDYQPYLNIQEQTMFAFTASLKQTANALNVFHDAIIRLAARLGRQKAREFLKHERRRRYHYRLSERNRLHPKRKPKGGR